MANPQVYSAQRPPELTHRHPGYLQKYKGGTSYSLFVRREAKLKVPLLITRKNTDQSIVRVIQPPTTMYD
jgi:hypothetical protein